MFEKGLTLIGIDPGVNTGLADKYFDSEGIEMSVHSGTIWAMIDYINEVIDGSSADMLVVMEDARLRTWFGQSGPERWQGAGSIKRDCQIWEEWLTHKQIPYILVPPMHNKTKMNAEEFARLTGISERTNQHERDAAALLLPYNYKIALATYEAKKIRE